MSILNVSNIGVESDTLASVSTMVEWRLLMTMATRLDAWKRIVEMRYEVLAIEIVMVLEDTLESEMTRRPLMICE